MKKILILGSGGVLGYSFKEKVFLQKYSKKFEFIFLTSRTIDLRNQKETINYIVKNKPYAILHLAGSGGGIGRSYNKHASILRDNIYMTFNVLEGARLARTKKILMTLTTGMYPKNASLPLTEDQIHNGEPVEYNYGNSYGKRIIEPAIRAYKDQYNLNIVGIIVSGIYGEGDNFNYQDSNMLPAAIRKVVEGYKTNKKKIIFWGSGNPVREYTYSKDLRDIYMKVLLLNKTPLVFNVSSLEEKSIKDIIKIVCKHVGYDYKNIYFNYNKKKRGVFKKTPSTKIFNSILKFKFTSLDIGIKKTIDWFIKSKNPNTKSKEKKFVI